MKKFLIILSIFITGIASAQTYSNGWIDYNKTYYKFKVGTNGLYHITQSTLNSLGLGNVPAEQFQLWRNGKEVALYTSIVTGILPSGGFIEFWGTMNDGKIDTKLYRVADYQLTDHTSLQTDTSAYFLTVNPAGTNLRYSDAPNNVAANTLAPEPYFMNIKANYFKSQLSPGYAAVVGSYVYSSSYDIGEGWVSPDIYPSRRLAANFSNANLYTGGPGFSLKFAAVGSALNDRDVRVKVFNTVVDEEHMPYFTYIKKDLTNLPLSYLTDLNNIQVFFENTSTVSTDRMVVAFDEVTYPSKWIFNNQTNFYFQLPATNTGNYLVINQFNYGSAAPVLFDLTSNKRYTGDISTPGQVKFALPPSADTLRKFELVSEDPSVIINVSSLQQRNFLNFGLAANQGDYLIITNPLLYSSTTGANNIDLYSQYRRSAAGGGFNTKVIDINELEDQFAYGIKKHPSSIKDFIQFAANTFSIKPKYVFLMGKGVEYDQYTIHQSSQYADKLNLVPTFGAPASDVLLASPYGSIVPSVPIGRLSAVSGDEVGNYVEKVKEYEQAEKSSIQTLANKLWMKKVVNIVGGRDSSDNDLFGYYMNIYKAIIEDTLYGANVETFSKSSSAAVQLIASQRITDLFDNGISLLAYFGHSSANVLEFNLSDPSEYNNQGRYPFFLVSGCTAGNNYIYDTLRILQDALSISENFVLSKERGSIGFLASSHLGIPPYLNNYNEQLFHQIGDKDYGNSIGVDMQNTIQNLGGSNASLDFFTRMHLEELSLNGDPAITVNPHPKPDYVIEDQNVVLNPQFISVSENHFTLQATAYNIGRANNDSIVFEVKRTYPNGSTDVILRKKIKAIYYSDSINISVPIISTRDKGLNKITVTIDADNKVDEMSESNNSITKEFYIYEDEARPVYPADFSIVNVANQKLYASTSDAASIPKDYVMEMDTTILFNSPFKITKTVNQAGGIITFDPSVILTDNTVYYWRVSVKPSNNQSDYHWNNSSFIYLANSSEGSNQSHYYQQLFSDTQHIHLDSSREWKFATINNFLESKNGVFPTAAPAGSDCTAGINGVNFTSGICPNGTNNVLIFNVVDPVTLKYWENTLNQPGLSGSLSTCIPSRQPNFAYDVSNQAGRKAAMNFLDSIPDNDFVFVRNITGPDSSIDVFADKWAADTSAFGSGNSLYNMLKSQGFVLIDSFYRPRAFSFIYQKNNPAFGPGFKFTNGISDLIDYKKDFLSIDTLGFITSPKFGPAVAWKEMHWRGTSLETNSPDNPTVQIIGIDTIGNVTTLFNVNKSQQDLDISSVNAAQYPYIQLKMRNADSIKFTPYQLSYWRLNYLPAPEGALAPNLYFISKDTLEQGEILHFGIAFKNISPEAFDSMKVKLTIIDANNVTHVLNIPRQKPLVSGDTITIKYDIDTKNYPGLNTIFVNFNPDNDQPEQYLFNNFLYTNFYVKSDNYNPTMDVTFDGVHILNKDIVSARPHIIIKLKDENQSLALNDTSLIKVQIQYPDGSLRTYHFDNDTMRFTPANLTTGENTATIDLTPALSGEDAQYELIVSGKDVVGNTAGKIDYHIDFRVISKPMISNMMNYPNPFTTSTAFVFTITGSEIPQNIRIQILTITGKVIREITENELGPLHIGRNITDFKWDGTDMYGQKVANGVYLYRVLTNLNGKSMDKFKDSGDNTDKYFTKGYGKMYFMR
ncbi:MAG: C25 family cysteine peptidase [Bacteroidota bacterium]|nr:C25 family cysteine peptidase [Bacteroidota bacterium]